MSVRIAVATFVLLAAFAAGGCSRHGSAKSPPAPAASVAGADLSRGKAVYQAQCAACHGERGAGGQIGPALQNESARRPYRSVYAIVLDPAPPMPKLYPSRLTKSDVRDVSAYVESL
ncbi:MAG TPA: cytochrome c [Candidatus Baltobacteraceae bacterium]|nr:cytochrome c [Candidatus Baltobacteraceae bacterium]